MGGMQRITLAYNNVYLVEREGMRVLIDTGPDYAGADDALVAQLGGRLPDLVIATHGHSDHAGLGSAWQARGVPVVLGAADVRLVQRPPLAEPGEFHVLTAYARWCGAPDDVRDALITGLEQRRAWAQRAANEGTHPPAPARGARWPTGLRALPFTPERTIEGAPSEIAPGLEAVMCPGHTPGNLVVVDRIEGALFSGDQLLPGITPTPGIQAVPGEAGWTRQRTLPLFTRSLEALRGVGAANCYPGHGEPFAGTGERIAETLEAIETRTGRVLQVLRTAGTATTYQVADALYPRLLGRKAWQTLASVQGHLDLLTERNMVAEDARGYTAPC